MVAAIHNAGEEAQKIQETKMGPLTEGLGGLGGGMPGGLGLPGM